MPHSSDYDDRKEDSLEVPLLKIGDAVATDLTTIVVGQWRANNVKRFWKILGIVIWHYRNPAHCSTHLPGPTPGRDRP